MNKNNNRQWMDVSTFIEPELVVWPGDPNVEVRKIASFEKDGYNLTHFSMSAHTGTHMDAPNHYLGDGATINQIAPERLLGQAKVFVVDGPLITEKLLADMDIGTGDNVIFKTSNSKISWPKHPFIAQFVHLDEGAAQYLAGKKINLVGIDYLSIGPVYHGEKVHRILLKSEILILEGLLLHNIHAGVYEMICLPLKIKGADGAPARVLLRRADG
jgi:arylformamidase